MRRLPTLLLTPVLALAPLLLPACSEEEPSFTDAGMIDADTTDGADLTAPETTLLAAPADPSNQDPARFEFTADRPATFRCQLDDGAAVECTSPYEVAVGEGARTFAVHAVSVSGVADATPATHAWVVDLTPPDTTITEAPAALDNSVDVSLAFEADEDATFTCAVDGGAAAPCTSPLALTGLADGPHSVVITATDRAGNVEVEPARHDWVLDSAAPDTVIDSGPTGLVMTATATFTFSSPDAGPGATFACSLDGAAFAACASPRAYSGLAEGDHTFAVRVTDATGNVDPTPAQRSWTVDTVAPTVTLGANPSLTSDRRPTLVFTTAGGPTQYFCRIDTTASGAFTACTSPTSYQPASNLADGAYVFSVYVRDAAGNTSATASHPFTVDATPPTVTLGANPALVNARRPTLVFSTAGDPTQYFCRINTTASGPFTACTSATSHQPAADLADGAYVFSVYVRDAAGNTSATVDHAFTVDATGPTVTLGANPSLFNQRRPTFAFT
ncbi:MAG: Ig-like domain repeat protein, partial [Myxococcales bacterium]|nr:Ig-like domain repeat protein [Myxococcales bacterium]